MLAESSHLLRRIILHSAKWPLFCLMIGILLNALSYLNSAFALTRWNIFESTDRLGNMFIALAITLFIYNFFVFVCLRYEQKFKTTHKITSLILSNVRKGSHVIFILVTLDILLTIASPSRFYLSYADNIINGIIIASLGWIAIQILYTIEAVLYQYMSSHKEHTRITSLYNKMHIMRNIATVVIIIITIAAILMSINSVKNIGISLLASAGFLTAIIGLAAQKTLSSLFAGIQIALSQPLKIGDMVVIDKESGLVEDISFTYVTLKLGDRKRLMVPITYFTEKTFENWSHDVVSLRSSMHLYVDYLMPLEPLREAFECILKSSPYWDHHAIKLQVSNLTEQCVELRLQMSAANADDLADLRAEVREKMLTFIRDHYSDHFPKTRFTSSQGFI